MHVNNHDKGRKKRIFPSLVKWSSILIVHINGVPLMKYKTTNKYNIIFSLGANWIRSLVKFEEIGSYNSLSEKKRHSLAWSLER